MYVPDIAKGIKKNSEFASMLSTATNTLGKLSVRVDNRIKNLQLLHPFRQNIKASFIHIRKKVDQLMDQMEHNADDEMERLLSILQKQLQSEIQSSTNIQFKIEKLLEYNAKFGKHCETFAFQIAKKFKQELQLAETLFKVKKDDSYKLEFTADPRIEELLTSMETLGQFTVSPNLPVSSPCTYTVAANQTCNIEKDVYETEESLITGICHLPQGQTVIVDQRNQKVKVFSSSNFSVVISEVSHNRQDSPKDVCHTKDQEIAVSLTLSTRQHLSPHKGLVKIINLNSRQLSDTKNFFVGHECIAIAYKKGSFYVASKNAVYKYDENMQRLEQIFADTHESTFCSPHSLRRGFEIPSKTELWENISLCSTSNKLFITNKAKNCLITMDDNGQMSQFNNPDLHEPTAVCVAENGTVFVYSKKYNTVLQVDTDWRKITILATEKEGLLEPRCMCFDDKEQRLLVGQAGNILVLKLK